MKLVLNKCCFFYFFAKHCELICFLVCNLQTNLFEDYVCKCRFNVNCHAFSHLMCPWKKQKTFSLVVKT
jgi:hypothetical protein